MQNKVKIDLSDLCKFARYTWTRRVGRAYLTATVNGRTQYLHRLITECPGGLEVDHINGDPLDNRKCNLRVCTRSANLVARKTRHKSASGHIGVYKYPSARLWYAQMRANCATFNLGTFNSPVDAALARDRIAKEWFGPFAVLNFPEAK